jgi:pyruvate oxidase
MTWHRVMDRADLAEGRVATVAVGRRTLALTHHDGRFGALDNACPHQGGPLGEGTIEHGLLRCPWHGYDYDPITGEPPPPFEDAPTCFPVEVRDGAIWVDVPDPGPRPRTCSDVLVETMANWGIDTVFGMVGHSNLGFADALREAEERGDLRYVAIRHEGAASFAASAYGKLTGRPAACFAIAGPGSTNLLTGLYDAARDRSPVVAISGQVPSKVRGRGAFQDLDLTAAFNDACLSSEVVVEASDAPELMTLACKRAIVGRGPTHLVLPDEIQTIPSDGAAGPGPHGRVGDDQIRPPEVELEHAVSRLADAERPVFVVGHGARFEMGEVIALAERLGAPVLTTFKAKGQIPDSHPLACGVLGRSGTPVASWMMNEADLLVVFGASFSNHSGIAPYKPTIQVDYDPEALGRFHPVDLPLWGHVGVTARAMSDGIEATSTVDQRTDLAERWALWRAEKARRAADRPERGLAAATVFDRLSQHVPADAVLTVDVGNNTYSFGRYFESKGQPVLMSGYLGSIGFGYPAAMGAWAAAPDRPVVAVTGDGGFAQYMGELTTAVAHGMAIKHILLNNGELGKISKEQRAAGHEVWQTGLHNPDFSAYARLCGAWGLRVTTADALDGALAQLFDHDGPGMVEIVQDPLAV